MISTVLFFVVDVVVFAWEGGREREKLYTKVGGLQNKHQHTVDMSSRNVYSKIYKFTGLLKHVVYVEQSCLS